MVWRLQMVKAAAVVPPASQAAVAVTPTATRVPTVQQGLAWATGPLAKTVLLLPMAATAPIQQPPVPQGSKAQRVPMAPRVPMAQTGKTAAQAYPLTSTVLQALQRSSMPLRVLSLAAKAAQVVSAATAVLVALQAMAAQAAQAAQAVLGVTGVTPTAAQVVSVAMAAQAQCLA